MKNISGNQSKYFSQLEEGNIISEARTSLSYLKCTLVLISPKTTTEAESDWYDDDLESIINYKIKKEVLCTDVLGPQYRIIVNPWCHLIRNCAFLMFTVIQMTNLQQCLFNAPNRFCLCGCHTKISLCWFVRARATAL